MATSALDPAIAQLIDALARAKARADYKAMTAGQGSKPSAPAVAASR